MNNLQAFGSGPSGSGMISGKWVNKKNGSTINVRDAIMQGDELIVMTDKGQISGTDFANNYIQMSEEEYDMSGHKIDTSNQPIVKQVASTPKVKMFDDIDDELVYSKPQQEQKTTTTEPIKSESKRLIEKLFSKINTKPDITIRIEWAEFPKNELNMLMDVFDVTKEDIASYMKKYLDDDEITLAIGNFLKKML